MWPIAMTLGAVCGLGVFLLVREAVPARPSLQAALNRLSGQDKPLVLDAEDTAKPSMTQRAGAWATRRLPTQLLAFAGPTRQDLDLIGRSVTTHYGEKALSALVALMAIPMLTTAASLLGLALPVAVPAVGSIILAVGAWLVPDLTAKSKAVKARATFRRAVSTYLELLAIERASGTGVNQAAFAAAEVARSWPFRRIAQALELGRWDGKTPWTALRQLSEETAVIELSDVADILEQAGREGSAIHDQLQSRAAAMRDAQLDAEQQIAHDATVRMTIPGTLTVLVYFMALLIPAMMSMFTSATP